MGIIKNDNGGFLGCLKGSLRAVVCYPALQSDDDTLIRLMCLCGLDNFVHRLDEVADWQHILSPGQIQRIGFVRILLVVPDVVFLDEVTSALDEESECRMYELLCTHLPHTIIVSVGHRSTLIGYHIASCVWSVRTSRSNSLRLVKLKNAWLYCHFYHNKLFYNLYRQ